eukprot:3391099-Pyramimonas_sp.AAC.1
MSVDVWVSLIRAFGVIFELKGLPMCSALPGVALNVMLCSQEFRAIGDLSRCVQEGVPQLRTHGSYISRSVGAACAAHCIHATYDVKLSTTSASSIASAIWLDLEVVAVGLAVIKTRQSWLYDHAKKRKRATVPPYVVALLGGAAGLHGLVVSRFSRARSMRLVGTCGSALAARAPPSRCSFSATRHPSCVLSF